MRLAVIAAAALCVAWPAFAQSTPDAVVPFRINVPDATLRDLRARLANTRFPDAIDGSAWDAGTDLTYLKSLVAYWRTRLRLAGAGAAAEPVPAVHDDHRRRLDPLRPSAIEPSRRRARWC